MLTVIIIIIIIMMMVNFGPLGWFGSDSFFQPVGVWDLFSGVFFLPLGVGRCLWVSQGRARS